LRKKNRQLFFFVSFVYVNLVQKRIETNLIDAVLGEGKKVYFLSIIFALTISILAVYVCQPITALLQRLPEESARACVQHQLPVDATEVLLAVLRIPKKIFFSVM
jgi:hypothetical protein